MCLVSKVMVACVESRSTLLVNAGTRRSLRSSSYDDDCSSERRSQSCAYRAVATARRGFLACPKAAPLALQVTLLTLFSFPAVMMAAAQEQSLQETGIIPDVISADQPLDDLRVVTVSYGGKTVPPGEFLSAPSAAPCPVVTVDYEPQPNEVLFVFMTDPDAPSRAHPAGAEWAHWVGYSYDNTFDAMSPAALPYSGPSPPSGSGLHRYVFLVYKGHNPRLHGIPPSDQRRRWGGKVKVEAIAKENNLSLVGITWMTSSSA